MADFLDLIHVSGGLLSPSMLAEARADTPRRGEFSPAAFAFGGRAPESANVFALTLQNAFGMACEQYDSVAREMDAMSAGDLREKWLLPLLRFLDFDPAFQRAKLKSDDGRESFTITHLGWNDPSAPPIVLVKDDLDLPANRTAYSPHDELQQFLNRSKADWGIAANGRRLRVLRDFHHIHTKAFVGFDLDAIFESRDFQAFRALYRLVHRSRFIVPVEKGEHTPLEVLFQESQKEGIQIGRALQPQVRAAIEFLAEGLIGAELRPLLDDPKEARALFHELLLIVYRILFMLFAEQRRMLPPEGLYAETYSITALSRIAEEHGAEALRRDLWEGLKVAFEILHGGAPEIGVFAYNGQLFDITRTRRLMAQTCENKLLLKAVDALTHVNVERMRQRVNYAELGVEELGSVYETLLNYTLRLAHDPTETEDKVVPRGAVYLAALTTERKDLGAYYSPPKLVDFVLSISLDRLIKERLEAAGKDATARQRALLDIRFCDPACGSGAFLVGAIDRLALALAREKTAGEKPTEASVQEARRDVLAHCVYGIDKDPFAVELCKVALWIHCAVPNLPLSFLDHRIQNGDALVGWPLLNVPGEIPREAYTVPSNILSSKDLDDKKLKSFLQNAYRQNDDALQGIGTLGSTQPRPDIRVDFPAVMAEEEKIPGDVMKKDEAFKGYQESPAYRRFKAAADIWTAAFFWSHILGVPAPDTHDYQRALGGTGDPQQAAAAAELLEEFPAFHWPLRFPEIAARGGFDCFVGNPPWEQFENREQEWFGARAPQIADMKGVERKDAIFRLQETDPTLWRKWRIYERINQRVAEYTRSCGRFTAEDGKANTYLLFTEVYSDGLRDNARGGIIVKSAVALDKTASTVFKALLSRGRVDEFHDIVNGGPTGSTLTFAAVDAKERFAVIGLRANRVCTHEDPSTFYSTIMNWNVDEAQFRSRQTFSQAVLRTINPTTQTLSSFRKPEEFEVALDIHKRAQKEGSNLALLDFEDGGSNPWGLTYATLFNSTTASNLFLKREALEEAGWRLGEDMIFRRKRSEATEIASKNLLRDELEIDFEEALPLYEGQIMNRYDHRAKTYSGYNGPNKYGMGPGIPETEDGAKESPKFEIETRYWVLRDETEKRVRVIGHGNVAMGFRNTARPWRDSRCAKAAILPRYGATDGLPILGVKIEHAFEFIGVFNSITFDFFLRGHMPGPNIKLVWMLSQLPTPAPKTLDSRVSENAEKLSLTSNSVAAQFSKEAHRWNAEKRHGLDIEIDALVAHAYGLTRAQYDLVLDSFEVLARVQTKEFGSYKFKEDCLEAYRKLG